MKNLPGYSAWFQSQSALQRKGLMVILAGIAAMVVLGGLSEHHMSPRGRYYDHRGLLDPITHYRVALWSGTSGSKHYLPYEHVFHIGMAVVGIGTVLLVMGAIPDTDDEDGPALSRDTEAPAGYSDRNSRTLSCQPSARFLSLRL
jgi:hypothetical protein